MMRFAYVVSVGVCLTALTPLAAQTLPTLEEVLDPWPGGIEWQPNTGTVLSVDAPAHGSALIRQDGTVVYTPTVGGDFWTLGSDRLLITVDEGDGPVDQRLTALAGAPTLGPATTDFETTEPTPHGDANLISFGTPYALEGNKGARIMIDPSGATAYFEFPLTPEDFRGSDNSDSGCAELEMAVADGGRQLSEQCLQNEDGREICRFGLLSALAPGGLSELFRIEVGVSADETVVRAVAIDQWNISTTTPWIEISGQPHALRMDWWTGNDGGARLFVDGRVRAEIRGVDTTDQWVEEMQIGVPVGAPGASLSMNLDAITLRNGDLESSPTPITKDSFEGDFSQWEAIGTAAGDIVITHEAALVGPQGLEITVEDGWGAWVLDEDPQGEATVGVRFRINAEHLQMGAGETLALLLGQPNDGGSVTNRFLVRLWNSPTGKRIRVSARDDDEELRNLPYAPLADGDHLVEFRWRAATEPGRANGRLRMWLDGELTGELVDINDHNSVLESIRFGAMFLQSLTEGVLYLDEFESWH